MINKLQVSYSSKVYETGTPLAGVFKSCFTDFGYFPGKKSSKVCFYGNSTKILSWEVSKYSE